MESRNNHRDFDNLVTDKLQCYVYGLFDPENGAPFYIGKAGGKEGKGNTRVLHHFSEARSKIGQDSVSAKVAWIHKIWARGEDVVWKILHSGLRNEDEAFTVESALIDTLQACGFKLSNHQVGHHSKLVGLLNSDDIFAWAAPKFDPDTCAAGLRERPIFVFNIHKAVGGMRAAEIVPDYVAATIKAWVVGPEWRKKNRAIAVGLVDGISRATVEIEGWKKAEGGPQSNRWEIIAGKLPDALADDLLNKNFSDHLVTCKGYMQRGGFPVIMIPKDEGEIVFLRGGRRAIIRSPGQ